MLFTLILIQLLFDSSLAFVISNREISSSGFNLFDKKSHEIIINLNCSILTQSFEIFKPKFDYDYNNIKFSLIYLNQDNIDYYPFELIPNRASVIIKKLNNLTDVINFYTLKLIARNQNQQIDEMYLNINLNKTIQDCFTNNYHEVNSNQIKILFADSLFSDFSELIFDNKKMDFDKNANKSYMVNLDENTQVDSFICYILIKSSSTHLNINGNGKDKFRLEQVDYGSTSFISASSPQQTKISPLISLYSLKLDDELDRELQDFYELRISLQNHDDSFINLNIIVNDVNDNEPIFEKTEYKFDIIENSFRNNCIGFIKAIDNDSKQNGQIKYSLSNSSLKLYKEADSKLELDLTSNSYDINELFYLNQITGEICVLISLDRECYSKYTFEVMAEDMGEPYSLKSSKTGLVVIDVLDINDNMPVFFEQNSHNSVQTCNLFNKTQFLFSNKSSNLIISSENYPQFYIQENSAPHTFIAWLKAYDLDSDLNSQIDYYLEIINSEHQIVDTQNYYEDHFFTIDSNGIVRSMVSFNIIDKENSNAKSSIEIDDSKVWIHKTNFLIKIIAKDRGKPSLQNEILINIKITSQKEKRKLSLSLIPNKTTIWIPKDVSKMYENPLVKIKVNENEAISNKKLLYQLIPFTDLVQNSNSVSTRMNREEDDLEYGKNCSQTDIIKYFTLNNKGEIYLSKSINNNHNFNNKSSYMICFVNVRVIDLNNLYQMHSNIEFTFIIYNNNDSVDTSFESILLRDKLLKKVNNFKKKFYLLYKNKSSKMITLGGGGNSGNQLNEDSTNNLTLAFRIRKVFGEQSFNLNFYLLISGVVLLLSGVMFIIVNRFCLKRTKLFEKRNNDFSSKLSFLNGLIKTLKTIFNFKTNTKSSNSSTMSNKPAVGNDNDSNVTVDNNSTTKCKLNESDEEKKSSKKCDFIFNLFRKETKLKEDENTNNKSLSSTRDCSKSNSSLEIKDDNSISGDNNINSTESGVYSLKQNSAIIKNNIDNQSTKLNRLDSIKSNHTNKIDNDNLDLLLSANVDEIESIKSSLRSFLVKEETLNTNQIQTQDLNKINNCGGIYQVSNQILIDYDDNTTCEINSSASKHKQNTNESNMLSTKSILKTDKNKFISNGFINDHSDRSNLEPLERFEKIYYQNPLSIFNCNQITSNNINRNLSNIGSFV